MSYAEQLKTQINARINNLIESGEPLRAQWIAHEVCEEHTEGLAENDHADFWRHGGYKACREEVRRCIGKRVGDKPKARDNQLKLPGFDHLQEYYLVERGGDEIGVPVDGMTDDEIDAKAHLYRQMGMGCFAHANELDRFKKWRQENIPVESTT